MSIYEKIANIQNKLNVGKDQYNPFGKFYYRTLPSVYEAVKPLLKDENLLLVMRDELEETNSGTFVKGIAEVIDLETKEKLTFAAYAKHADTLGNMSPGQITGTSSTYARKYCLGGLFLIDDEVDLDEVLPAEVEPKKQGKKAEPKPEGLTAAEVKSFTELAARKGFTVEKICASYKISKLEELPRAEYENAVAYLNKKGDVNP